MVGLGALFALAAALLVLWVALGPGASWMLEHLDKVQLGNLDDAKRAEALDRIRGRAVAVGTGMLALVAIFFTARTASAALSSSDAAQQTAAAAQQTAAATEQGMVTGRYTAAIDQLGSDKLDIRLGGVYALERIARDSARDHPTVIAVLAAFVREHSHDADAHTALNTDETSGSTSGRTRFRPDLQDALTVIGRRATRHDVDPINLRSANLARAELGGAKLRNAILVGADLTGAKLIEADLANADLLSAILSHALLMGANLTDARLTSATLINAKLRKANLSRVEAETADMTGVLLVEATMTHIILTGANLTGAHLVRVDMSGASLAGARLTGANISGADLTGADLTGADMSGADLRGAMAGPNRISEEIVRAHGAHVDELTRYGPTRE